MKTITFKILLCVAVFVAISANEGNFYRFAIRASVGWSLILQFMADMVSLYIDVHCDAFSNKAGYAAKWIRLWVGRGSL